MSHIVEVPGHLSHSSADNLSGPYCPEEWRPAPGLDGYEVSCRGRVRSWRNRRGFPLTEPVVIGHHDSRGYQVINPRRRGGSIRVHRLVCEAFNGPPPEGAHVCRHLNDIKGDNRPENLAWGTHSDNAQDRERNGHGGVGRGRRKLTAEQVREIRAVWGLGGRTKVSIAKDFGVSDATVGLIVRGETWREEL